MQAIIPLLRSLRFWVQRNVREIARDPVLRYYGAFLALTHVITYFFWRRHDGIYISDAVTPICWPFWEDCYRYRFLGESQVAVLLGLYLVLGVLCLLLFLNPKRSQSSWWILLILNALKLGLIAVDFRLRGNAHYMAFFAATAFLFFPDKRRILGILTASFYFWAGILKLNPTWLSGTALYKPVWLIPESLLPAACGYVVLLELVLIWGIFSVRGWLFWMTLAQLVLFHILSWSVVGFLYPMVMFCLITIYPLNRLCVPGEKTSSKSLLGYILVGILGLLQFQFLLFPGNLSVTGEGRFLALDMFDSKVVCEAYADIQYADGYVERRNLMRPMPFRIRCDPIVYFNRARALCRDLTTTGRIFDLTLHLNSRKKGQADLKPVISFENFCSRQPSYDLWRHNDWIQTPPLK